MEEDLYGELTPEEVDDYLAYIGLTRAEVPMTVEGLDLLVQHHARKVPFENVDLADGRCATPSLGVHNMFERIVHQHKGGYCFMVNGAFNYLLKGLGFEVYSVMAKIVFALPVRGFYSHRGNIVTIDGQKYYVDVGMGGRAPDAAIPVPSDQEHARDSFYIEAQEDGYLLMFAEDGKPRAWFRDLPAINEDFLPQHYYLSARKESTFTQPLRINLRTDGGNVTVQGDVFTVNRSGESTERTLTREEIPGVLEQYFGILRASLPAEML